MNNVCTLQLSPGPLGPFDNRENLLRIDLVSLINILSMGSISIDQEIRPDQAKASANKHK